MLNYFHLVIQTRMTILRILQIPLNTSVSVLRTPRMELEAKVQAQLNRGQSSRPTCSPARSR